ncbi:type II toxin-antitoxin system VapC family toxin [Pseudanabaena galeata UHCC 0370]|jgi:tRNA(fMet)-specific endonuclease VapC|uniref:Type II toxin-antitoxin system VapC family toxin n=1 Tax=Pseudanabaena galeata UHCC 0370 TaxID=3110310 RepID=A0ABU5TMV7_9CYAN|nr:type II toxin-antitoxin system VapC family toxin [Pseudanabaena galeata]MEA5479494.1 type II toxin-antitoxin system VapC family toxin [Pseudanabaena galeata UHCC 0370]
MTLWILDTDHISLYQRGDLNVINRLSSANPKNLAVTVISLEEQMYGRLSEIKKATSAISLITAYSRLEITLDYFKSVQVLPFDQNAHTSFESLIRQKLRVGTQDLRIAAIALSVNGIVVTRNQKDFGKVPNLQVENWAV